MTLRMSADRAEMPAGIALVGYNLHLLPAYKLPKIFSLEGWAEDHQFYSTFVDRVGVQDQHHVFVSWLFLDNSA